MTNAQAALLAAAIMRANDDTVVAWVDILDTANIYLEALDQADFTPGKYDGGSAFVTKARRRIET